LSRGPSSRRFPPPLSLLRLPLSEPRPESLLRGSLGAGALGGGELGGGELGGGAGAGAGALGGGLEGSGLSGFKSCAATLKIEPAINNTKLRNTIIVV